MQDQSKLKNIQILSTNSSNKYNDSKLQVNGNSISKVDISSPIKQPNEFRIHKGKSEFLNPDSAYAK